MMCISHSVMEGQRHNNPLKPRCFCLQRPKTHIIVVVAKALGGSFKLVTLAPRTVREMAQLPKETQKNGGHKQVSLANHLASTDNLIRTTKRQNTYNEN